MSINTLSAKKSPKTRCPK